MYPQDRVMIKLLCFPDEKNISVYPSLFGKATFCCLSEWKMYLKLSVTNCIQNLSTYQQQFKPYKFILLQFCMSEILKQGFGKAAYCLQTVGELVPLLFPTSRSCKHSLAYIIQDLYHSSLVCVVTFPSLPLLFFASLSLTRTLVITLGMPRQLNIPSPTSTFLN